MSEASQAGREVARRAGLVSAGTLGSRILGMVRDVVIAASFPVAATDAFFIALTIPNTGRVLLGEGAVQNAFVPVFAEVRGRDGLAGARRFLARFGGALACLLAVASLLGAGAAPWLGRLYAAGYRDDPAQLARVVGLTRVLFPFLFAAGIAALTAGALNSIGRFAVPALSPAWVNIAMIAGALTLSAPLSNAGLDPVYALAAGALLGGVLQTATNATSLARAGLLPKPRLRLGDPDVRKAIRLMLPLVFGLGIYQVNIMLSRLLASFLPTGSQSYLSYGQRVVEIPQGMFALALAAATLPSLSAMHQAGQRAELLDLFRFSLRMTAFVAIPASVGLWTLREPTLAALFGRGAFTPEHVEQAAWSLGYQAMGVCAFAGVRTVVPMFAAQQETRIPVLCSALSLLVFLALSLALMGSMQHAGLALANSAAAAIQLCALLVWLQRRLGSLGLGSVLRSALRTLVAALVMGAVVHGLDAQLKVAELEDGFARIFSYLGLIGLGGIIFLLTATLLGSPELAELRRSLTRRLQR